MKGIIKIDQKSYLFRSDHGHGSDIWAWDLHADSGQHVQTFKWKKLPAGELILFDPDNPPRTVSYNPLLD